MLKKFTFGCMIFLAPLFLYAVDLTQSEQAYLDKLGVVKVCIDPDWKPFEYLNEKGEYEGIGADFLNLIASRAGIKIELLKTKDWDESIEASKSGKCQIVSFLNETPKRDQWLLFSDSHFKDANVFITREEHPFISDPSDLINETIVFPEGTAMEELIKKRYPNLKIITTPSELEAFHLVSEKKAHMTMRSLIIAAYTIKTEGLFNLKISGQLSHYQNIFRVGIIKSEPTLRDIINKAIATITPEDKERIINKHISIKAQTVVDYTLAGKVAFWFLILVIFALYRNYELEKYNKKLKFLSETDMLTKIYNRSKIERKLYEEMKKSRLKHYPLCVISVDIDFFKKVNDTHGHQIGDLVLMDFAHIAQNNIRPNDIIGRYGGEEFLIICPHANLEEAQSIAQRVRKKVESAVFANDQSCTISAGVASLKQDEDLDTLLKKADIALYKAKQTGRNKVCI